MAGVIVRLSCLAVLGAAWVLTAIAGAAAQSSYPSRPVSFVVPYTAGGSTDVITRMIAKRLEQRLGQSFVVENRPGAGTTLAAAAVARGTPDGHTLLFATSTTLAFAPSLYSQLAYDPVKDFTPIGLVTAIPFVLVVQPSLGVNSLPDLIALLKAKPGELSYGSAGPGSPHHLAMELFKSRAGVNAVHVPYRGTSPALTDIIGGRTGLMFVDAAPALGFIADGRLKALAVSSARRLEALPDVPTIAELIWPDFDVTAWQAVVAPPGVPKPVVDTLNKELLDFLALPATKEQLTALGVQALPGTPQELTNYTRSEIEKWGAVIKGASITVN